MIDAGNPPPAPRLFKVGRKMMSLEEAERFIRRSATWFWIVAGLSLINTIAAATDMNYRMIVGLGITMLLDELLPGRETTHLVFVFALVGLFVAFGMFARRLRAGWYLAGIVVYAADALLFILAGDWIAVGFHAFVLLMLWGGYGAILIIRKGATDAPDAAA